MHLFTICFFVESKFVLQCFYLGSVKLYLLCEGCLFQRDSVSMSELLFLGSTCILIYVWSCFDFLPFFICFFWSVSLLLSEQ